MNDDPFKTFKIVAVGFGLFSLLVVAIAIWQTVASNERAAKEAAPNLAVQLPYSNEQGLGLPNLGVFINDPKERGLSYQYAKIGFASGGDYEYIDAIADDKNQKYEDECEFPASIRRLANTEVDNLSNKIKKNDGTFPYKRVGDAWYIVETGTSAVKPCILSFSSRGELATEYRKYQQNLREYIHANLGPINE